MKPPIERILFWFRDGKGPVPDLIRKLYPLSMLWNRLINASYQGKRLKLVILYYNAEEPYKRVLEQMPHGIHSYGGHIQYQTFLDLKSFARLSIEKQTQLLWERTYEAFKDISSKTHNPELAKAAEYAFKAGLSNNLNLDFVLLEKVFPYREGELTLSLWFRFENEKSHSLLRVETSNGRAYEVPIDSAEPDSEFFFEMYRSIDFSRGKVVVKGARDVDYLPWKHTLREEW